MFPVSVELLEFIESSSQNNDPVSVKAGIKNPELFRAQQYKAVKEEAEHLGKRLFYLNVRHSVSLMLILTL